MANEKKTPKQSLEVKAFTANQQLIRDVANLPYAPVVGLQRTGLRVSKSGTTYTGDAPGFGLQYFKVMPTIGSASDANAAATVAAKAIFADNRRPNSGSVNYEAPDYLMYHVAVYEAHAAIRHFARVYGLFKLFNDRSRVLPERVLAACGVSSALINELPALRAMLNYELLRLNSLNIYSGFPIGATWLAAFNEVYADSKDPKASLFLLVPDGFHYWDGTYATTGSALLYSRIASIFNSVSQIKAYLDGLIDPLMADEDISIMSGDTLKAFPDALYKANEIPADYVPTISYNTEVMTQLENAEVPSGILYTNNSGAIFQDQYGNIYQQIFESDVKFIDHIFNLHWNNPEPKDNVLAARFKRVDNYGVVTYLPTSTPHTPTSASPSMHVVAAADFVVTEWHVLEDNTLTLETNLKVWDFTTELVSSAAVIFQIAVLDWHPIVTIFDSDNQYFYYYGDLDNFTWLGDADLKSILDAMTLSMLGVPTMVDK